MKIIQDLHIHTNLSLCAARDTTAKDYIPFAKEDGLTTLGFSNHLWDSDVAGASKWYSPQNLEHVLRLKRELPESGVIDGVRVLFGCETEFTYEWKLCLTEEHMDLFDFILAPHSHTHQSIVVPQDRVADIRDHAQYLMDSFLALIRHPLAHRITAVAHPFVPGTRYNLYNAAQALIPTGYFCEAFHEAKEKGIAIEVNGSCLTYLPEDEIPKCEYVRIYRLAKECGCKFTYGSDSHDHRDRRKIHLVERFLDQCGITESDFYLI